MTKYFIDKLVEYLEVCPQFILVCSHKKKSINRTKCSNNTSTVIIQSFQSTIPPTLQSLRSFSSFLAKSVGSLDAIELESAE